MNLPILQGNMRKITHTIKDGVVLPPESPSDSSSYNQNSKKDHQSTNKDRGKIIDITV